MSKTEVLVECPVCRRDKWVDYDRKKNTFCYECPDLTRNPPGMIPQIILESIQYITREVK